MKKAKEVYTSQLWNKKPKRDIHTVLQLVNNYSIARDYGLQEKKAKQYAMTEFRMSRYVPGHIDLYSPNIEKNLWYRGESVYDNSAEFEEIVLEVLDKLPDFEAKDKVKYAQGLQANMKTGIYKHPDDNAEVLDFVLQHIKNKDMIENLQRAAVNYERVTEKKVPHLLRSDWLMVYKKWLNVTKGEDLFIKGWGRFDIKGVVKKFSQKAVPDPKCISAQAYGVSQYIFEQMTRTKYLREYFAKNIQWVKANIERMDEIRERIIKAIKGNPNVNLERMLNTFMQEDHERQVRDRLVWLERMNQKADFSWLQGLEAKQTEFGLMKPIQSTEEIVDFGVQMRNCIANYTGQIATKQCLLLVLLNEDGSPYACGEVRHDPINKRWVWGQRLGIGNQKLEEEVKRVFETYPLIAAGIYNVENGMKLSS